MSQTDEILKHLIDVGPLTPIEALKRFGCFRLGARIWDLKQRGHTIKTTIVKSNGKNFAKYEYDKQLPLFQ